MKKLIKTIDGAECEIYAVKNHQRFFVGKATPTIEIYQRVNDVETLGKVSSQYKIYEFSLIICSNPELDRKIQLDCLEGISYFDLKTLVRRKDDIFVSFEFAGLTDFSIDVYDEWIFNVNDYALTQKLIAF
jgi:hypothetical protein